MVMPIRPIRMVVLPFFGASVSGIFDNKSVQKGGILPWYRLQEPLMLDGIQMTGRGVADVRGDDVQLAARGRLLP